MPEIKHTFQAGKMNKDLDERLVPNGEYRHADNVQVRTTDGSDVGTVQNIKSTLKNSSGSGDEFAPDVNSATYHDNTWMSSAVDDGEDTLPHAIASVVDEKKDKIYFFYSSPKIDNHVWDGDTEENLVRFYTDTIVEQDVRTNVSKYIAVDNYAIIASVGNFFKDVAGTGGETFGIDWLTQYVNDDNFLTAWPHNTSFAANTCVGSTPRIGMTIKIIAEDSNGDLYDILTLDGRPSPKITAIQNGQGGSSLIYTNQDFNIDYFDDDGVLLESAKYVILEHERALNFNNIITGINVIDNLLFWTDNTSEPKKINIDRCEAGTNIDGNPNTGTKQTQLYIDKSIEEYVPSTEVFQGPVNFPNNNDLIEEHITTIRKAPRVVPQLKMLSNTREGLIGGFTISYEFVNYSNNPDANVGQIRIIQNDNFVNTSFRKDDIIIFEDSSGQSETLGTSPTIVKVKFICYENENGEEVDGAATDTIRVKLVNITGYVMTNMDVWDVDLELPKPLFELKLARFAYRYKYEDGEYSAFSPWSEIAFLPGQFRYSAKKAFNLGMVNNVRDLKIQNYLPYPRPLDIKEVDILYKSTDSPSVYVAHTIKRNEDYELAFNYDGMEEDFNTSVMKTGSFTITSEMIHKLLPENQMLRAWDNVPRYAKAQEIVGNRLLFANYTQGYNMEYPVGLAQAVISEDSATLNTPQKSIKSLRSYKFGMVFGDKYGRETPVIESGYVTGSGELTTTATGDLTVPKLLSSLQNCFELSQRWGNPLFPNAAPLDWMSYIKYYVKETTSEYYNLIMDRWYWANQFNTHCWISFPSADRNKLDMETHMILKNKHDSQTPVHEKARYKIIDIKNDVPPYVSTRKIDLGEMEVSCGTTFSSMFLDQDFCVDDQWQIANNNDSPDGLMNNRKMRIMLAGFNMMLGGMTGGQGPGQSEEFTGVMNDALFGRQLKGQLWFRVKGHMSTGPDTPTFKTMWKRVTHQRIVADDWDGAYSQIYFDLDGDGNIDYDDDVVQYMNALEIHWDEEFGGEADMRQRFIDAGFPTDSNDGVTLSGNLRYYLEFREHVVEHKAEYDGRFFVKIESDGAIQDHVVKTTATDSATTIEENYSVVASFPYNYIATNAQNNSGFGYQVYSSFSGYVQGEQEDGLYNMASTTELFSAEEGLTLSNFVGMDMFQDCWDGEQEGDVPCLFNDFASVPNGGFNLLNACDWDNVPGAALEFWTNWRNNQGGGAYGLVDADQQIYKHVTFIDGAQNAYGGYNINPQLSPNTWRGLGPFNGQKYLECMPRAIFQGPAQDGFPYLNDGTMGGITLSYLGTDLSDDSSPHKLKEYLTDTNTIFRFQDDPGVIYRVIGNYFVSYSTTDSEVSNSFGANSDFTNSLDVGEDGAMANFFVEGFANDADPNDLQGCVRCPAGNGTIYLNDNTANIIENPPCDRFSYQVIFRRVDPVENETLNTGLETDDFDPRSILIHTGESPNRTIQILAYNPVSTDMTEITSEGACWETEPKTDVDLDIYHEASSSLPLILNDDNCYDFAPISAPVSITRRPFEDASLTTLDNQEVNVSLKWETYLFARYFRAQQDENKSGPIIAIKRKITDNDEDDEVVYDELNYPTTYSDIDVWTSTVATRIGINDFIYFTHADRATKTKTKIIEYYEPMPNDDSGNLGDTNTLTGSDYVVDSTGIGETYNYTRWKKAERRSGFIKRTLNDDNTFQWYILGSGFSYIEWASAGDFVELLTNVDEPYGQVSNFANGIFISNIGEVGDDGYAPVNFVCAGAPISLDQLGDTTTNSTTVLMRVVTPTGYYQIDKDVYKYPVKLGWFNCYSFGNGVESDRIRDDYNAPTIDNGVKVSSTFSGYREEKMSSGLIYSGLYNSTSQVNDLNEFNMSEKITKDLNPSYGSIQALKTRDTDVVVFAEDKILKIIANKDAVYNADGNPQLVASNRVLGTAVPFVGDYGISSNPESLAWDQFRLYFTDKQRGSVLRLSRDGLTPISNVGMQTWFRDNLRKAYALLGTFDVVSGEYNLTVNYNENETYLDTITNEFIPIPDTTVSFSEASKGWVSFKSFVPESGKSASGKYFTSRTFEIFEHHNKDIEIYNNFYDTDYESSVKILFNDTPSLIKSFKTVNYEGSQSKITQHTNVDNNTGLTTFSDAAGNVISDLTDGQYYNLDEKPGWYVNSFETDLQSGLVPEFIEKEGKWFNKINGLATTIDNLDQSELTVQGLGMPSMVDVQTVGIAAEGQFTLSNYSPGESNEFEVGTGNVDSIAEEQGPFII